MYTLLECLVIAGFVLVLGTGLFLVASLLVLMGAVTRTVATSSRLLASRATTMLREKWGALPWPKVLVKAIERRLEDYAVNLKAIDERFLD